MGTAEVYTWFWYGNLRERLGRPRIRWEDNIKMGLQEVGCGGMDWMDLARDRDRFHKIRGISLLVENRLASQRGLC
jgi:hypothetical protein